MKDLNTLDIENKIKNLKNDIKNIEISIKDNLESIKITKIISIILAIIILIIALFIMLKIVLIPILLKLVMSTSTSLFAGLIIINNINIKQLKKKNKKLEEEKKELLLSLNQYKNILFKTKTIDFTNYDIDTYNNTLLEHQNILILKKKNN